MIGEFIQYLNDSGVIGLSVISPNVILWRTLFATVIGFIISLVCYLTYSGENYEKSVIHTIWLITVVASLILNVIGDNMARAFGLFGVLSFIRFRTTLRDTKDTAVFFFAVSLGIASGLGFFELALIGLLFLIPLLFLLKHSSLFSLQHTIIKFSISNIGEAKALIEDYFKKNKVKVQLVQISVKTNTMNFRVYTPLEKTYEHAEAIMKQNPELIPFFGVEEDSVK